MEISIAAEKLFSFGSFPVTNAFLVGAIVSGVLMIFTRRIVEHWKEVPRGAQNVLEIIVEASPRSGKSSRLSFPRLSPVAQVSFP